MVLNDQEKIDYWIERIGRVEPFVSSHTFAVYTSADGRNFVMHGSCVTVSIDNEDFVCTAEHLIKSVLRSSGHCVVGINGRFEVLYLTSVIRLKQDSTDYDICLLKLKQSPTDVHYLRQSDIFLAETFGKGTWQYLQGFPLSKNKRHDLHDHENSTVSAGYINIAVRVDQTLTPPANGQSSETHFFFRYERTVFQEDRNHHIEFRNQQNALSLRGCSGCGIWTISEEAAQPHVKLAAIFTTHGSSTGSATKAENLLRKEIWVH